MRLKICKHGDGCGYCLLHDEYCPESPCPNEELIDYEPVVHGRYITDWLGDSSCSVCGAKWLDITQNYCPNCGAKMDLEVKNGTET